MGSVISSASVSLDGFIAYPDHSVGRLFDWYDSGDVAVSTANAEVSFRLSAASADHLQQSWRSTGALVVGRTLFDLTDGWGGSHPIGVPVVVLTHRPPTDWNPGAGAGTTHFVTEGIEAAVATAQQLAGEADVAVAAGTIARQCLVAGLLDEVGYDLVPLVMGSGRPYFGELDFGPVSLGDPTTCIRTDRVTHLVFPVSA